MASEEMGKLDAEVVKRCCTDAFKVHKSSSPFTIDKSVKHHVIFAFRGSWSVGDWFRRGEFGECKVDPCLFPSLKVLGSGVAAFVNEGFSSQFRQILAASGLRVEVKKAIKKKRKIVFTGHSSGGALAILATIWLLEKHQDSCGSFCITFGSPLVGDKTFGHAIRRERWSSHFLHIVLTRDITPCVLFSPLEDINTEFQAILQQWDPRKRARSSISSGPRSDQLIRDFFTTLTNNAFSVASHDSCILQNSSCGGSLLMAVARMVEVSPYRPFGRFVFCCGGGRMVSVDNHDAVLQILFYTLQLECNEDVTGAARFSAIDQQINYRTEVKEYLRKIRMVDLHSLEEVSLSWPDARSGWPSDIDSTLTEMGLSMEARLSLRAAGETEKMKKMNQKRVVEGYYPKIKESLRSFGDYRSACEAKGMCYYDAFKLHAEPEDFKAYVDRLEVIGIWEDIREKVRLSALPDTFESDRDLVEIATKFRHLLEPIDIANFYRREFYKDSGLYTTDSDVRPKYYKYPENWLRHMQRFIPADEDGLGRGKVSLDSCFWARVENMFLDLKRGTPFSDIERMVLEFEDEVHGWFDRKELGPDVLVEGSTFMKWWVMLPLYHRARSRIREFMEPGCGLVQVGSYI